MDIFIILNNNSVYSQIQNKIIANVESQIISSYELKIKENATHVPDDNFENFLETNGMGNGIPNDNYVYTSAIDTLQVLDVGSLNIADLTGIQDFTALTE